MIEPSEVTTVLRRPVTASDKPRTLEDYQAALVRMFARVPSWPELAKREEAARWHRNPVSNMARPQPVDNPGTAAANQARLLQGEATRASIVAALTAPMTCHDVAHVLKRSPQLIRRHLGMLAEQGRVTGRAVKGVTIWERRQEAAE